MILVDLRYTVRIAIRTMEERDLAEDAGGDEVTPYQGFRQTSVLHHLRPLNPDTRQSPFGTL
jgi:hypothetical protein